ncbi:MAG: hypothetical protein WCE57_09595 [Salegentibacter sp.]
MEYSYRSVGYIGDHEGEESFGRIKLVLLQKAYLSGFLNFSV